MAHKPHPDDPYRANDLYRPNNPSRANPGDDDLRRAARLDNELQVDPELAEGPAGGSKIALFALGIALVLGAVFYGLNNSSVHQAGTPSTAQNAAPATAQNAAPATAQNAAPTSPPAAPPGMRDVTPRANSGPGTTTGAAPAQTPPPQAPTGPTNNAAPSK
jgi:hypothetical protein